ncbi:MBL fold metallo-hydrolase [Sphingomonas sp. YL-JM2C]
MSKWTSKVAAILLCLQAVGANSAERSPDLPDPVTPAWSAKEVGTRLVLLGTGGGPILTARSQPASLLVVDGRPYLIDCGAGTLRQLKAAGFGAFDIGRIFLTHLHFDHTADLASVFAFNWIANDRQPVDIFGPPGTEALVKRGLDYFSISEDIYSAQFPPHPTMAQNTRGHDISVSGPQLIYQDDKIKVLAIENSHYSTLKMPKPFYGALKSYSYRIETPHRTIIFTGDTGPSQGLAELARGADILVSEVINVGAMIGVLKEKFQTSDEKLEPLAEHMRKEHLTPEEVGRLAAAAGVKMVVLSHLAPGSDTERDSLAYVEGVRRTFSGTVVAGKDLSEF